LASSNQFGNIEITQRFLAIKLLWHCFELSFTDVQHWNGRNSGSAGFSRSIAAEAQKTRGVIQWQVFFLLNFFI